MILDTSIWVDVERGRIGPADVAAVTGEEPVYLVPPVLAELEYGVHRAQTASERQKRAAALARIARKPCLPIEADTALAFARLAAELDAAGTPAAHRLQDLWIAACGIQHAMPVLTANAADFGDIPGLEVWGLRSS